MTLWLFYSFTTRRNFFQREMAEALALADGAFIGKASGESLMPGAQVRLPFGIDERIRVDVRQEPEHSGKTGVFARQNIRDERLRFEVTNYHSFPIKVELLDRRPVPLSKDVHVEVDRGGTTPTQSDYEQKPGLMLWAFDAEPRKMATVLHSFSVRYPNDKALAGFEVDGVSRR